MSMFQYLNINTSSCALKNGLYFVPFLSQAIYNHTSDIFIRKDFHAEARSIEYTLSTDSTANSNAALIPSRVICGCASNSCGGVIPPASSLRICSTVMRVPLMTGFPNIMFGLDTIIGSSVVLSPLFYIRLSCLIVTYSQPHVPS